MSVGQSVGRVGSGRSMCYPISPTPQLPHSKGTQPPHSPHPPGSKVLSTHKVHRPYHFTRFAGLISPPGSQALSIQQASRRYFAISNEINIVGFLFA